MSKSTLLVGSIDCNDRAGTFLVSTALGSVERKAGEYGGLSVDVARQGAVDESARVVSTFVVRFEAYDHQSLVNSINRVAQELRRERLPVIYGEPGTATVELRCGVNPTLDPARDVLYMGDMALVTISVSRDPWLYEPSEPLYSGAGFELPALVDLSAMRGLGAAPLDATVTAPGADLRALWAGAYPDAGATIADFVHTMAGRAWSGGAAAADGAGYPDGAGNTLWGDGSDALVTTSIDTASLLPGDYLVLARCKMADALGSVFCGASTVEAEMLSAQVTSLGLEWYPLGLASLPTRAVRGSASAPLYVGLKSMPGGTIYVNCVALVPASWGLVGWRDPASHCHALVYEDGMVYADDLPGLAKAMGDRQLRALGGSLVAVGGRSSSVAPTLHTHWTLAYEPRWEQLPSGVGGPSME